ncbi:NifB/NifX family molybdenum-iron cluster-binding protein [Saccharicrinis sp. FJH62]|uniref:NifB/NifX family molybdenum-iron cluster-binding protein n=1 Tax=Saccharicrinis sp. FJH62 TaxID=3344657 RepID=UPI0035D4377A
MKTAISVSDKYNNRVSDHFVRCRKFMIIDAQNETRETVTNPYHMTAEDAGIQAINYLKALGVTKLIAGDFGVHVQEEARKQNIQLIIVDTNKIKIEALKF